ncbi:hypothetical protein E2I00_009331, partial [Balaenoptera physalus]
RRGGGAPGRPHPSVPPWVRAAAMTWSATARGAHQPDNTAFTQQRLPAWQPLLSASIALPLFFCAGLAFIGLGLGLYYSSNGIKELEYDYTGDRGTGNCSRLPGGPYVEVPLDRTGIAWWTDYHVKFRNPPLVNGSLALAFQGTAPPPSWHRPLYARIRQGNYSAGLPRGTYRNPFLGIAYLVVGSLCILTGFVMLVVYIRYQDQNDEDEDDE